MTALIDADIIVYRAGFAAQTTQYHLVVDDNLIKTFDLHTKKADVIAFKVKNAPESELISELLVQPVAFAKQYVDKIVQFIKNSVTPSEMRLFLTANDKSNYRFKIAKTPGRAGLGYKAGRASKPEHYEALREYLVTKYKAEVIYGQEADDALGIEQYKDFAEARDEPENYRNDCYLEYALKTIICSIDKDLKMIPGCHFNIVTGDREFITEFEGYKNFCNQLLIGDNADNIPGIRGIGKKRAANLLKDAKTEKELLDIVKGMYYTKFKEDADRRLLEIGQLLWIRRHEGELWHF